MRGWSFPTRRKQEANISWNAQDMPGTVLAKDKTGNSLQISENQSVDKKEDKALNLGLWGNPRQGRARLGRATCGGGGHVQGREDILLWLGAKEHVEASPEVAFHCWWPQRTEEDRCRTMNMVKKWLRLGSHLRDSDPCSEVKAEVGN